LRWAIKALVVYDSTHGNTEKVAQAIGDAVGGQALQVNDVDPAVLKEFDLLIVGSPTHGGFPTPGCCFVLGVRGPLKDGELERAAGWAKGIAN
jgi:flavodoxin